jgi:aspartate aminotransferase-like enzyme
MNEGARQPLLLLQFLFHNLAHQPPIRSQPIRLNPRLHHAHRRPQILRSRFDPGIALGHVRDRPMHHRPNLSLTRGLRQIGLDHPDLNPLFLRQLRTIPLRKLLRRILPLLDQRRQNLRLLRIRQRCPLIDLLALQRRLHHPQRRQPVLIPSPHRHHNIRLNLLAYLHRSPILVPFVPHYKFAAPLTRHPPTRYNKTMIRKTRLFTPGPTPLLPAAQFAMAAADIHHRTPEFRALYTRVLAQLKDFVGTKNDVILLSSSGTGAMEASVSNLTSPGDRVLVLSAGKFGERWTALAKAFGCEVDVVSVPYGQTFSLNAVKAALKLETRVVFMQATETSTGVRNDTQAIAKLLKDAHSEALLVVDAITGLGTTHLDMDAWGVDVLIGGSQKAVMIPPGLSFLAVSDRAWERMEASYNPRYYFDLRKERKNAKNGESAYTPAVALIAALGAALDYIAGQAATAENPAGNLVEGRKKLVDNAETIAAMTRAAVQALGMTLFSPTAPAAAATAVLPPAGVDSGVIVKELKSRFGVIITNGQGEMKGQIFRIAHLGFFDFMDTIALIGALEQVVAKSCPQPGFAFGNGLIAAQKLYAEHTK